MATKKREIKKGEWVLSATGKEVFVLDVYGDMAYIQHCDGTTSRVALSHLR